MANKKISQLTTASTTTPSDLYPIVQLGVTKNILYSTIKNNILSEVPGASSLYTGSGTVPDNTTATTKLLIFKTDLDGVYNPDAKVVEMKFGGTSSFISGNFTNTPGAFTMITSKVGNQAKTGINVNAEGAITEIGASLGTGSGTTSKIYVDPTQLLLEKGTPEGTIKLDITSSGMIATDGRTALDVTGLSYSQDYSAVISTKDRSIPDVGTVKLLRQQTNVWTNSTRPTAAVGIFGFNTDIGRFEGYDGSGWVNFH